MMATTKFTLLVTAVLIASWATNANEGAGFDAISSADSSKELVGNVDNEKAATKSYIEGRKFGENAKFVKSTKGGHGKKQIVMKVGTKQNVKALMNEDANDSGFVAFNADYHAPRHHPPKNN